MQNLLKLGQISRRTHHFQPSLNRQQKIPPQKIRIEQLRQNASFYNKQQKQEQLNAQSEPSPETPINGVKLQHHGSTMPAGRQRRKWEICVAHMVKEMNVAQQLLNSTYGHVRKHVRSLLYKLQTCSSINPNVFGAY